MNKYHYLTNIFCIALIFVSCTSQTDRIRKEIKEQNRQLPKMVTDSMRIDSILFSEETNTLGYYYTILNDSIVLNCNYNKTQKDIASEIKRNPSMADFRNRKMIFEYIYISDKSKDVLLKVVIPESMYK